MLIHLEMMGVTGTGVSFRNVSGGGLTRPFPGEPQYHGRFGGGMLFSNRLILRVAVRRGNLRLVFGRGLEPCLSDILLSPEIYAY